MDKWVGETPFIPISDADIFALLDYYCNPELPILSEPTCQAAVGLKTPANLHHRGIDHPPWMARSLFKHRPRPLFNLRTFAKSKEREHDSHYRYIQKRSDLMGSRRDCYTSSS
jgi:hypothetical protein